MKKRTVALLLAVVLVMGAAIGGTVAWLVADGGTVKNTFTVGDITIDLDESKLVTDANGNVSLETGTRVNENSYNYVPGDKLPKDPIVYVESGSQACYLFIKVTESNNTYKDADIVNWGIAAGWTQLTGVEGVDNVWYREVDYATAQAGTSYYILSDYASINANGSVSVTDAIVKEDVSTVNASVPTLYFQAAAVQLDNIDDVATAYAKVTWPSLT